MNGFDYKILHKCQYEVGNGDCGEPATHKVWWEGESDAMLVCQEHFKFIQEAERENEEPLATSAVHDFGGDVEE